jgi:gamma-glutamyltranspeptidase/glutathione hydrolase
MKLLFNLFFLIFLPISRFPNDGPDSHYLITATMSQEGVTAGMKILEQGGTAMDAALSVALSEIAESSGKFVSYAGRMNLVYFEAATGEIHTMDATFNTVLNETDPFSIPVLNVSNLDDSIYPVEYGRTILVPGFMKGLEESHKRFGSIPFPDLFNNAIKIAEEGRPWNQEDESNFNRWKKILTRYPATKSVFTKSDGSYYKIGENFNQPELTRTLRKISTEGADYMYKGEWAVNFVKAARILGSKITLKDLENYKVIWSKPVKGNYHGFDVYSMGKPGIGGVRLLESLNIAEITGLSGLGHHSKSPCAMASLFHILQASLYSSYHSTRQPDYFGDSIDLSFESRLNKETSKQIWEKWVTMNNTKKCNVKESGSNHSAAIVATDQWGNMVALLHTINTINWGFSGLFVNGVSIPDPAGTQQELVAIAGPGNRISDETTPGIILRNGKPVLGFACINPGFHNQTLTSILDVLDFRMTPQESVNSPTIGKFEFVKNELTLLIEPDGFSDTLLNNAGKLDAIFHEDWQVMGGAWSGIYRCPETGELSSTEVWLK